MVLRPLFWDPHRPQTHMPRAPLPPASGPAPTPYASKASFSSATHIFLQAKLCISSCTFPTGKVLGLQARSSQALAGLAGSSRGATQGARHEEKAEVRKNQVDGIPRASCQNLPLPSSLPDPAGVCKIPTCLWLAHLQCLLLNLVFSRSRCSSAWPCSCPSLFSAHLLPSLGSQSPDFSQFFANAMFRLTSGLAQAGPSAWNAVPCSFLPCQLLLISQVST